MIGEQKLSIDGKEYALRADWKTGQLIAERVADPFTIIADFAKAAATSAAMAFIMLFSSDADLLGEGETNGEGKEPTGENS